MKATLDPIRIDQNQVGGPGAVNDVGQTASSALLADTLSQASGSMDIAALGVQRDVKQRHNAVTMASQLLLAHDKMVEGAIDSLKKA